MRAFFDTNVVVYAYDSGAGHKRDRAQALIETHVRSGTLVLSTQVMVESYQALQRAALLDRAAALEVVETLAQEHVVAADAALALRALRLAQHHQLSHWDSLIVQAAMDSGCRVLFSEDMQSGMRLGELEIVNPFVDTAHEVAAAYGARVRRSRQKPQVQIQRVGA